MLLQNTTIDELALIFQRSRKSIFYRLRKLQKENPIPAQEDIFIEYYKVFRNRSDREMKLNKNVKKISKEN